MASEAAPQTRRGVGQLWSLECNHRLGPRLAKGALAHSPKQLKCWNTTPMNCRYCKQPLEDKFVDLLDSPPSNAFLTIEQLNEPELYYPLVVYVCHHCHLVQIDELKKATEIFDGHYAYFSSYSRSWVLHARRYVEYMIERFGYDQNSFVIEVASNDGYLLQHFKDRGVPVLGIEPTQNTANAASVKGIPTIVDYFGSRLANELQIRCQEADLLIGNNVLAHVPDIGDFIEGFKVALRRNGVITMEFPHLLRLVENCEFDTIYHEHYSYLSLTTVKRILDAHALELFDVQELPTHGGSLRIFARHKKDRSKCVLPSVQVMLDQEEAAGMTSREFYRGFQSRVDQIKFDVLGFLLEQNREGKCVAGYGAAAKGNTLLNYCGVKGTDLIRFVVDASPIKQGKFLPGSHIPVCSEERIRAERPDFIIILPWNLREEIMEQLAYVRDWGCRFVVCIPKLEIF
jgi:disulfide oxidoreductase YuzD